MADSSMAEVGLAVSLLTQIIDKHGKLSDEETEIIVHNALKTAKFLLRANPLLADQSVRPNC